MAVLSKIRERSILLIGIIGFCLLAFVIGDVVKSGNFSGGKYVGSVNGTDIPYLEFNKKVANMQQRQPGATYGQTANYIWNLEVNKVLFADLCEKAGIRVGKDHVLGVYAQSVGNDPRFLNAAGKFDKAKFNEFLVGLKTSNPTQYQMIESERPEIESSAKTQLYVTALKAGFFTTNLEAKQKYAQESDKANFDYVYVPYSTVNDEDPKVKVTDQELIDYMKKNEKKYKAEASRDLEVVFVENKPSAADEAEVKKTIEGYLQPQVKLVGGTTDTIPSFATMPASEVEEFVNLNSEMKYDTTYYTKAQLPVEFAQQILALAPGQVFGPYNNNGMYTITRMMGKKPGASTKVAHVLVAYKGAMRATVTRTEEEAKKIAEGYLAQVNANPDAINLLARANSDDPGAVQNGGVYDVTPEGGWAKEFKDFAVASPKGKTGIVKTDFGFHVMRILDKEDGVRVASIAQKILPSEATIDANFQKASKLEMEARDSKKPLKDLAKAAGLTVMPANHIAATDENIPGVGAEREVVRWAYSDDTKIGDVKKFDTSKGSVVVSLKAINEKGVLPLEEAKTSVLPIVRNEKKAKIIREKMKGATLEAVAQSAGASVASATGVTLASPMIMGVGPEIKVVGKAFGLAAGKTSALIDGQSGVFIIRTKNIEKAPALPSDAAIVNRLNSQGRGGLDGRFAQALKDKAKIEDDRAKFY
ncbi:peptidylprolyl isomerase [Flavobacterium sp. RHBU_3]|uniref:peptidylprolyl isomerase n=1 Tax=Flavobacterium sp. RHBU_3 TaxID=3391184 RepID=UPI003984D438